MTREIVAASFDGARVIEDSSRKLGINIKDGRWWESFERDPAPTFYPLIDGYSDLYYEVTDKAILLPMPIRRGRLFFFYRGRKKNNGTYAFVDGTTAIELGNIRQFTRSDFNMNMETKNTIIEGDNNVVGDNNKVNKKNGFWNDLWKLIKSYLTT